MALTFSNPTSVVMETQCNGSLSYIEDMFTVLAVNMEKCCARSNVEKECLKELTLLNLTLNLIPNATLTVIPQTNYFGYDNWNKNQFVAFKFIF